MGFNAIDLELLKEVQGEIEKVKVADLDELKPGGPVPRSAKVRGVMSPTLKAMLIARNRATLAAHDTFMAAYKEFDAMRTADKSAVNIAMLMEAHRKYETVLRRWNQLYVLAVRAEFPGIASNAFTYGPNFEMYELEGPEGSLLGIILLGGQPLH